MLAGQLHRLPPVAPPCRRHRQQAAHHHTCLPRLLPKSYYYRYVCIFLGLISQTTLSPMPPFCRHSCVGCGTPVLIDLFTALAHLSRPLLCSRAHTPGSQPRCQPASMTRGNQREEARARALKKAQGKGVSSKDKTAVDGMTHAQRMERDAKALQEKAAKKAAQKEAEAVKK